MGYPIPDTPTRHSSEHSTNKPFIPQRRIEEIAEHALLNSPAAWGTQTGRIAVLFGEYNQSYRDIIPPGHRKKSASNVFGTILVFEDKEAVAQLQEQYPETAEDVPILTRQSNEFLQLTMWTMLEHEGLHTTGLHNIRQTTLPWQWDIPDSWELNAEISIQQNHPTKDDMEPFNHIKLFTGGTIDV